MCGIAGFTGRAPQPRVLDRMLDAIAHRGPDDRGVFVNDALSLGVNRLAIVDVEHGKQPVAVGAIVVALNGAIVNHHALRDELRARGRPCRTRSDTEVLAHLYELDGLAMLSRLRGMFAIAIWDGRAQRRRLVLARDVMGIKPMHYAWDGTTLVFASEAKALLAHPAVMRERDPIATHQLLNLRYVPGERTLFRGVRRLLAGHAATFDVDEGRFAVQCVLPLSPSVPDARAKSLDDHARDVAHALARSVAMHADADADADADASVGFGAFLSGGIDSSAVVALASRARSSLQTFTLGLAGEGDGSDERDERNSRDERDERDAAARIARRFGTQHTSRALAQSADLDALWRDIVDVTWHAEEPRINGTQALALARLARASGVKVALSGLGGDELFYGYDVMRRLDVVTRAARFVNGSAASLHALAQRLGTDFSRDVPRRALRLAGDASDACRAYVRLRGAFDLDDDALADIYAPAFIRSLDGARSIDAIVPTFHEQSDADANGAHPLVAAMWTELRLQLVDDFLLNEDRMSMAAGLEVRVPFLDVDVVQLALRISPEMHGAGLRGGLSGKRVLRRALQGLLPRATLHPLAPKRGFARDPASLWPRGLAALARRVLTDDVVEQQGVFDVSFMRRVLAHDVDRLPRLHARLAWMSLGLRAWDELFLEASRDPHHASDPHVAAGLSA